MASSEFLDYFGFGYSNPISAQDISPSSLALCDDAIFEANYGDLFGSETFTRADDDVFGGQQGLSMFPSFPTLNMSLDLSLEGHNTAVAELAPSQSPPQNQVQYLAHEILGERETGNRDLDPNAYTGDPLFSTTLLPMPSQLSSSEHDEAAPSATDEMPNNEHPLYPIFVDDHGRPNQQFLAELELLSQQPQQQQESSPSLSSSRTGPSRTRARDNSAPYPQPAAVPHTHTKKAKARDDDNAWHVIVSPPSAIPPEIASASGSKKRGRRRSKDIFQHVDNPTERPPSPELVSWYDNPIIPPLVGVSAQPKKRKSRGPHSEMGWVIARLREPGSTRGKYGWAIAELNDRYQNRYLVLSGPHAKTIKTIREYDRIAYSPDAFEDLRKKNAGRSAQHREEIYDKILHDPSELSTMSSYYGTVAASIGLDAALTI